MHADSGTITRKTFYFYEGEGGKKKKNPYNFNERDIGQKAAFSKGADAPLVAVYLLACQGARFLLCLRRLIAECL